MKHASEPQTISWFQEQYKAARLELRPPFQRKPVWSDKQRCALIESILMDVPIPEVYVQATHEEDGTLELGVVDGQQRLRTILQFAGVEREEDREGDDENNNFSLDALSETSPHYGKSFADVTGDARNRFYRYQICCRFLYTENQREVEDVFKRLNKFMMPLKPQELRNATFHGAFAKLSEQLADDDYWAVNRIITPASIRRMGDIEMMSDLLIGLIHGPQGGSAKLIDQYYEQFEPFEDEFPEQQRVLRLFRRTHKTIAELFPKISETRWGNRADFYSLFVALGHGLADKNLPKGKYKKLAIELNKFAVSVAKAVEDPSSPGAKPSFRYARAVEKGSNDKARRAERHEVLLDVISPFLSDK